MYTCRVCVHVGHLRLFLHFPWSRRADLSAFSVCSGHEDFIGRVPLQTSPLPGLPSCSLNGSNTVEFINLSSGMGFCPKESFPIDLLLLLCYLLETSTST